jgi:wyosine [tRNA(Phe)-imidazoG37] synthetase (radical SAM superfamily)
VNIELMHIYGPYSSSVYGNVVLVDSLMPPKKCPLDCVSCPLGATRIFNRELTLRLNSTRVISELSEAYSAFSKSSLDIDAIYVWGFGDSLVPSNIVNLLREIRDFTRDIGAESRILVHTSMISAGKILKYSGDIGSYVDKVIVPYLWYGEDKAYLGWNQEYNFNQQLDVFKSVSTLLSDRIAVELHVFRLSSSLYPDMTQLAETVAQLRSLSVEEVVVKCVDRPSTGKAVKSAPKSYVEKVKEELVNAGFEVKLEVISAPLKTVVWRNTITALYNFLVRMPLKHAEIVGIYGPLGLEALNNLVAKKLVVKEPWSGSLYYRGVVT